MTLGKRIPLYTTRKQPGLHSSWSIHNIEDSIGGKTGQDKHLVKEGNNQGRPSLSVLALRWYIIPIYRYLSPPPKVPRSYPTPNRVPRGSLLTYVQYRNWSIITDCVTLILKIVYQIFRRCSNWHPLLANSWQAAAFFDSMTWEDKGSDYWVSSGMQWS